MNKNIVTHYSSGSKLFHWVIAFIVITMLSVSFFLESVPEQYQSLAYAIHKSLGLTVLFLTVLRFFLIMYRGKPVLPPTVSMWDKVVSRIVQYSFYLFLIVMPICGWIMSVAANRVPVYLGLIPMPLPIEANKALAKLMNQAHETIAWVLIVLVVLHVAGALKHHFIDKDNVLKRMLPGK